MKYAAIMFDVVESRKYQDRYLVQDMLIRCVDYLNDCYGEEIEKDVVSSAGDEFQGLFKNLESAFLYIRKLQLLIYPVKVRCGIGYGEIKYNIEKWASSAIDGEAYYLARDAIREIGSRRGNSICFNTGSQYDKYLNLFCESDMRTKSWQSQIACLIELIADLMMPIVQKKEEKMFYEELFGIRLSLIEKEKWNRVSTRYKDTAILNINTELLFEMQNVFSTKGERKKLFYYDEFWARGMSTDIAQIMNTTRQNIDRYISLGKIKESRTMDKYIYELLGEKTWQIY